MALLTGRMEWSLDTDSKIFDGLTEAEFLAKSIKDVSDHYGQGLLDQKTLDWCNLVQCLAIVYGGRIYAIRSTPRVKAPPRQPTVHEAAQTFNPAPPSGVQRTTPLPTNDPFNGVPSTKATIAGIGDVDLPDTHPLSPNYKSLN